MIARPLPLPEPLPEGAPAPRTGSRSGRAAVHRRRALRKRSRYLLLGRIVVSISAATLAIGIYLALMANVTRMNYELNTNAQTEVRLTDESARLDDEIERLSSRERLAGIGASLGMHESDRFAQISAPVDTQTEGKSGGIAFLPWLR